MQHDEILFVEKYRPRTIADCILPSDLKATFQGYVDAGSIPNLILAGSAGTGKTTVARAMCEELKLDYILINGSDESGIETLRTKVKGFAASVSLYAGRKVIIIDEADYLNPNSTQPAFRGVIEEFSSNCSFIFTCNFKNRIIEPLHSRCAVLDFRIRKNEKQKLAGEFMRRVEHILQEESIAYDRKVIAELIMKFFPDFRRVLNEIQRYSVGGNIDAGILALVGDVKYDDLVTALKNKNYTAARKWVADNHDNDAVAILRELYDRLSTILEPASVPAAVQIISQYSYQMAFASDMEIQLMGAITEMMAELKFK